VPGSIGFDRAAEYYDRTRTMSPDARAATIRMLAAELGGRGAVLEVGVGTGQIALALHSEGLPMTGVDISAPMLAKLLEKAGGGAPFPLALADGAALPFRAASFGAVVMRHVLHLVPSYADVIDEVLRVLRPGGVALTSAGWHSAVGDELDALLSAHMGHSARHVGLDPRDVDALDAAFVARGAVPRPVEPIVGPGSETLADYVDSIERSLYSWTWRLSDDERAGIAAEIRRWAASRGVGPGDILDPMVETRWRAYDAPRPA
jgi:SAM-dependent methyltransferase